jgi:hypothetical protein
MAEQTFRSPGFFEQEIDLSARQVSPTGVPAGIVGTSERGPAFVPVTVGSFKDFETRFGTLDPNRFGPYAVKEWLQNRTSCTYIRVLGAGSNETSTDISNTNQKGTVKNAGFVITGTADSFSNIDHKRHAGQVRFLCATHDVASTEVAGYPLFTDNVSYDADGASDTVNLVRAVLFEASGTKLEITSTGSYKMYRDQLKADKIDHAHPNKMGGVFTQSKYFKVILSSSAGASFANDEGIPGIRIITASLDPKDPQYISKVLNTDPLKFQDEQHLLYLDFAVEHELASVSTSARSIGLHTGSSDTSAASGEPTIAFNGLFGKFDTRYTTPRTTNFISQPYGKREYDLFNFESISDGAYGNDKFKVSIANLRASTDPNDLFGTFEVQVRSFGDKDTDMQILERYPECSLNPRSERYVAKMVGDKKVRYDFDQEDPDERRLVITGKYPNKSARVRIQMNSAVETGDIPQDSLPFGFRGVPVLKTNNTLTDREGAGLTVDGKVYGHTRGGRLEHQDAAYLDDSDSERATTGSIVPPLPMRFKITRGAVDSTVSGMVGRPSTSERVDGRFYWGVNNVRIPTSDALSSPVLNANVGATINPLVHAYTKFQGIKKLDVLVTGSGADVFNSNKFTLARVALGNKAENNMLSDVFTHLTGTAREHMLEASYIRDGMPDRNSYTVDDRTAAGGDRLTLASLVHTSSVVFNRFTEFAKFTNLFYGGFDGVNILDRDLFYFRDRAFSTNTGGKSVDGSPDIGLSLVGGDNQGGEGRKSNSNASVRRAVEIITDPISSNINILSIPGVREPFVTDHALDKVRDYSMAIYLMDSLKYDEDGNRLYDNSAKRVDVRETSEQFESRAIDNNYGSTYFPDVFIQDAVNNQTVKVPASVAALGALGASDSASHVWFAPAGFNRGSLGFVKNVENRLTSADRDTLYDARMNPIAVFPNAGFVVFGQKTLQFAKSALDRVNVRRLMLEIKRQVVSVANNLLFEPNNSQTRARFTNGVIPLLAAIQLQAGIESFKVVMDETNNTASDIENNKLNGRIVVVPTRAVEFISVDFVITNSGVAFE